MPIDHKSDPWPQATYRGFAGGRGSETKAAAPPRRVPRRVLLAGGVAGALALGVVFGLLMRPQLIESKPPPSTTPAPSQASSELAPPGAAQVPIAVSAPQAPEPIPRAPGKLQTLPPELSAAARAQVEPPMTAIQPAPPSETAGTTTSTTSSTAAIETTAPQFRASFDCGTARPGAEEMVCSDAGLAAADRQMARAYRRAARSGFDPGDLRQEQRDWVAIREDAARHSERALASVYDQRIHELNEIANAAPGPFDEGPE